MSDHLIPAPGKPVERGTYAALLRNRYFLLIWLAQALSQTAQNIINFAVIVEVENISHSSTGVGLVIVAFSLPAVIFGAVAGSFCDRLNKRQILVTTNVLRAIATVGYLIFGKSLLAIYLISFISSSISQFFAPAEAATLPTLVKRKHLLGAMSLFNLTFTLSQVAGFVIFGPTVYKLLGVNALYIAIIAAYSIAALLVWFLPPGQASTTSLRQAAALLIDFRGVQADVREVMAYLRSNPSVRLAIVQLTVALSFLMTLAALGPGFASRVLHLAAEDSGYILAPTGLGLVLGTILLGQFGQRADRHMLTNAGMVLMGITMAVMVNLQAIVRLIMGSMPAAAVHMSLPGFLSYLSAIGFLGFCLGWQSALITVPAQTAIQEETEDRIRGRVFAVQFMIANTVQVVPILLVGSLADLFGIVGVMTALSLALLGTGLLSSVVYWRTRRFQAAKPVAGGEMPVPGEAMPAGPPPRF